MFSVIVLVYNKPEQTRRCLESLLRSTDSDRETIVVDNGSDEETARLIDEMGETTERTGGKFGLIRNERNLGTSTGRNQGIARARGEYVVFLDNDVYVGDDVDWLSKLRAALDSVSEAGIVVPKLVFAENPLVIQCAGCAVSETGRVQFMGRGEAADDPRFARRREIQCGISACMMIKRSVIDEVGELDEAFNPVQYEDLDYCYRARSKGYKVIYEPAVTMLHDESTTTAGTAALNNRYIVIKHGMIFKERWRHMFETEQGPPDEETKWRPLGRFSSDNRDA